MRHSETFRALLEDALTNGAAVRFRAEGASMYPTIRDGEIITVAAVSTDRVVVGDVLLCRQGARVLAHRVAGVTGHRGERSFQLRGDAKSSCDEPVGASAVVGRVVSVGLNGRFVPLCGRAARLRRAARAAASRTRAFISSTATALSAAVSGATTIVVCRRR